MKKYLSIIILGLLVVSFFSGCSKEKPLPPPWEADEIKFEFIDLPGSKGIRPYIRVHRDVAEGESAFSMLRLALPEQWIISSSRFEEGSIIFQIEGGQVFQVSSQNAGLLWKELIPAENAGAEEEIERLWHLKAASNKSAQAIP